MTIEDAVVQACAAVAIQAPKLRAIGRWLTSDTFSGRNGKGDGRVIINDTHVTAFNWQTGESATVGLSDKLEHRERLDLAREIEQRRRKKTADAHSAALAAMRLLQYAELTTHPYLKRKGFPDEETLVVSADDVRRAAGSYLIEEGDRRAIVVPARVGAKVTSAELIWESGRKKFLFGGEIVGAGHRIARGADTWLCEGYATGLSLRAALRGFGRADTVLCCLSAANVRTVARAVKGRCFIAADHDKPQDQFGGLGAGEHFAKASGQPYIMPPEAGTDFNDMHVASGIFAVQRVLTTFLRQRPP